MKNTIIIIFLAFLGIGSVSAQTANYEKIIVGAGPEDFVLDNFNGRERLLISCAERRKGQEPFAEIMMYDIKRNTVMPIKRSNEPDSMIFNPHGVDLKKVGDDLLLFVVNHPKPAGDQVLIYEVKDRELILIRAVQHELFVSLNAVAALDNGSFYVSNDSGKKGGIFEKLFALRRANIAFFDAEKESVSIVMDKLAYANGVICRDDKLYISTTQKKDLLETKIMDDGELETLRRFEGVKGMDNLSFHEDYLLFTAHPKFFKFLRHVKKSQNASPSEVYQVDLKDGTVKRIFYDDGQLISAAATALYYKEQMYIGQVFDNFLLKIPFKIGEK